MVWKYGVTRKGVGGRYPGYKLFKLYLNYLPQFRRILQDCLTERDQLAFLDAVLQQENTAGIPNSVAIHFTSVKDRTVARQFDKTFVFLGFDFNEWHLRLIMHLIGRYQRQKETYALQNPGDIAEPPGGKRRLKPGRKNKPPNRRPTKNPSPA